MVWKIPEQQPYTDIGDGGNGGGGSGGGGPTSPQIEPDGSVSLPGGGSSPSQVGGGLGSPTPQDPSGGNLISNPDGSMWVNVGGEWQYLSPDAVASHAPQQTPGATRIPGAVDVMAGLVSPEQAAQAANAAGFRMPNGQPYTAQDMMSQVFNMFRASAKSGQPPPFPGAQGSPLSRNPLLDSLTAELDKLNKQIIELGKAMPKPQTGPRPEQQGAQPQAQAAPEVDPLQQFFDAWVAAGGSGVPEDFAQHYTDVFGEAPDMGFISTLGGLAPATPVAGGVLAMATPQPTLDMGYEGYQAGPGYQAEYPAAVEELPFA